MNVFLVGRKIEKQIIRETACDIMPSEGLEMKHLMVGEKKEQKGFQSRFCLFVCLFFWFVLLDQTDRRNYKKIYKTKADKKLILISPFLP